MHAAGDHLIKWNKSGIEWQAMNVFLSDVHPKSRVFYYFSSEYGTTSVIQYTDIWVLLRLQIKEWALNLRKQTHL